MEKIIEPGLKTSKRDVLEVKKKTKVKIKV